MEMFSCHNEARNSSFRSGIDTTSDIRDLSGEPEIRCALLDGDSLDFFEGGKPL